MPEGKKETKERFVIAEVPTQTAPVIQDSENEEVYYNELTMLCLIANEVMKIKKNLM